MSNPYYTYTSGNPAGGSRGLAVTMQSEFQLISDGFDAVKTYVDSAVGTVIAGGLPVQAGNANRPLVTDGSVASWSTTAYFGLSAGFGTTNPLARISASRNSLNALPSLPSATMLHLAEADSVQPRAVLDAFGANGAALTYRTAQGTSALPTATQNNDLLGVIESYGYGANAYSSGARSAIGFYAGENWTNTAQGSYLTFSITNAGSALLTEAMRIGSSGRVLIGTTSDNGSDALQVNGPINASALKVSGTNISAVYETQSHASSTYETQSHASSTYETQSHAASTYETKSHAASTYAPLSEFQYGTYTPTITNNTNAITILPSATYMVVGNVVTVSFLCAYQATVATGTSFDISLPISSNISSASQLSGSGTVNYGIGAQTDAVQVSAVAGNPGHAHAYVVARATSGGDIRLIFQYTIQ